MRVRGAGGLLIGVAIYPAAFVLDIFSQQDGAIDLGQVMKDLLWYEFDPPANFVFFTVLRDVLLFGSLLAGVLGLAGVRASRFPLALCATGIALGLLPSVIYNPFSYDSDRPPDWVRENQLWFLSGRWSAVLWIAICVTVVVMALTDKASAVIPSFGAPQPAMAGGAPASHWARPASTEPGAGPAPSQSTPPSPTAPPTPAPPATAPAPPSASPPPTPPIS